MTAKHHTVSPPPISLADQAAERYEELQRGHATLVRANGQRQDLPRSLSEFLAVITSDLREGQQVTIVQDDAQLTTVEAARMLGTSRQFLVNLLERDEIPFHLVGTHRRVYVRDLLSYKSRRDNKRRQVLDQLTRAEAKDGLYDLEPPDDRAR